jgi:hypothetical protein
MLAEVVPSAAISVVVVVVAAVEAAVDDRSMFPTFVTRSNPLPPIIQLW